MKTAKTVAANKVVTMQYSLTNTDGVVVRKASERPVTYLHGAGVLFPKLEHALESHGVGDIVTARLLSEDAFGRRDIDLLHSVPRDELPAEDTIEVGSPVVGTDEDGNEITFTVTGIEEGIISLDGNHPLAGQALIFEVEIQEIRDATADEIRTGKAGIRD